jgi:hypothetical protein
VPAFVLALLIAVAVFAFLVWDNLLGARKMMPKPDGSKADSTTMPFHSIAIRIVSSYLQVSGTLLRFDLTLPKSVETLITFESGASSLGERLLMFECLTEMRSDYYLFVMRQVAMIWLIPLASIVCCSLFWLVIFRKKWSLDGFTASLMVLFYSLFPSIVTRVALASSCSLFGSKLLLSEALSVTCWSERHWVVILTVGLPGLVFVLFIPIALARLLTHQRLAKRLYYHQSKYEPKWTLRYGFIFAGYRIGYEWWESVIMLRKCCFVLLSIFLNAYGATPQCVGASMILVAALSLHLQYQPFLEDDHNRLESIGLHACLLQLLVALMCNAVGKVGASTLGPVSTLVMIFTMFASSVGFFYWAIRVTIQSSKEADGAMGKMARFCRQWCGAKRKVRVKRRIVPAGNDLQLSPELKVDHLRRHLNKTVNKAVIHHKANKVIQSSVDHIHKHKEKMHRMKKKSTSRLQARLSKRKSMLLVAQNGDSSPVAVHVIK